MCKTSNSDAAESAFVEIVRNAVETCLHVRLGKQGEDTRWTLELKLFAGFDQQTLECLGVQTGIGGGHPIPDDTPDDMVSILEKEEQVRQAMISCWSITLGNARDDARWGQMLESFPDFSQEKLDCLHDTLRLEPGRPMPDDTPDDMVNILP